VRAAGLALLDHRDGDLAEALHELGLVGEALEQPVRARQPGGATAHDRHADLDALVLVVELALDELPARVDRRPVRGRDHPAVRGAGGH
jgi:hypothetical protein